MYKDEVLETAFYIQQQSRSVTLSYIPRAGFYIQSKLAQENTLLRHQTCSFAIATAGFSLTFKPENCRVSNIAIGTWHQEGGTPSQGCLSRMQIVLSAAPPIFVAGPPSGAVIAPNVLCIRARR